MGVVANGIGGAGSRGYRHDWYADYDGFHENVDGGSPSPQSAKGITSV